jgi:hypothetical protein
MRKSLFWSVIIALLLIRPAQAVQDGAGNEIIPVGSAAGNVMNVASGKFNLQGDTGNVGIGSTVPQAKLDVEGSAYFGNGNIGVGSSVPSQKIDVLGTVKASAFSGDGSGITGITGAISGLNVGYLSKSLTATSINDSVIYQSAGNNIGIGSTVPQAKLDVEGSAYFGNGNIGIGTSVPNTKLTVFGTASMMETDFTQNVANNSMAIANVLMPNSYSPGMMWYISDSNSTKPFAGIWTDHGASGSHMYLGTSSNYTTGITNHGIAIDYNGNVGIGTSVPNTKLTVLGTSSGTETDFTQNVANNSMAIANPFVPGNYSPGMVWYTSDINPTKPFAGIWTDHGASGSYMYLGTSSNYTTGITNHGIAIDYNGNVGIGSTAPQAKLSFGTLTGSAAVHLYDGGAGARFGAGAQLSELQFFVPGAVHISFNAGGDLQSSGTNELMRIQGNGNVGIGSSWPQAKLDVEGSIYVGNGNVGLGSSSPLTKLDVSGNAYFNGNVGIGTSVLTSTLQVAAGGTLAIPQGTAPTVSLAGQLAIDTTADQLVYYGGAQRVLNYEMTRCGYYADLSASDIHMSLGAWSQPVTITGVGCTYYGTGTTVATLTLEDGNSNAMTITGTNPTCTANGTAFTFAAVTAGNALNAGQVVRYNVTNTPAPITDDYTICVKYVYTRQ